MTVIFEATAELGVLEFKVMDVFFQISIGTPRVFYDIVFAAERHRGVNGVNHANDPRQCEADKKRYAEHYIERNLGIGIARDSHGNIHGILGRKIPKAETDYDKKNKGKHNFMIFLDCKRYIKIQQ